MIAVSTAWRSTRVLTGQALFDEITRLPTKAVELEFRIPPVMFEELLPFLERGELSVVSIHNFFPVPDVLMPSEGSGDAFLLSSEDDEERALAVKYSKQTLNIARELRARNVVFHLGLIPLEYTKHSIMRSLIEEVKADGGSRKILGRVRRMREERGKKYFENCLRSLEELVPEAERTGVNICLENRYYPTEIPDNRELMSIFERFGDGPVCYWHDVGHAMIQERIGFDAAEDLLRENAERMAGVHLHDVAGFRDHLAPGSGEVDFARLKSFLPGHAVRVIEVHASTSLSELAGAFDYLDRMGYDGEGERSLETGEPDRRSTG